MFLLDQQPVTDGVQEAKNLIESSTFNDFISDFSHRLVNFAIDIAISIFVFYVGKFIIKRLYKFLATIFVRRKVDNSLATFLLSLVNIVLYFILIVTVIGILGIETTSFLALFASAGVAIGMALSGTLQNFAGGVLILLLKPYKVGDYIEAEGFEGKVNEIQIFHTIITTMDNKAIMIPNGVLSTTSINNWSREEVRRVSWDVGISYGDSVDAARKAILEMFADDSRILCSAPEDVSENEETNNSCQAEQSDKNDETVQTSKRPGFFKRLFMPRAELKELNERLEQDRQATLRAMRPKVIHAPVVLVNSLDDSAVVLTVRVWVKSADYWDLFFHYNERIYNELPTHGINFPFPQLDVHVTK